MVSRENVQSEHCMVEELSGGELSVWGNVRLGTVQILLSHEI